MSLNSVLQPNNYQLYINTTQAEYNDLVFSINHTVPNTGPITNAEVVTCRIDGAKLRPSSAVLLYRYSSAVLGTINFTITNTNQAITYYSGSFIGSGAARDLEIPLTSLISIPLAKENLYLNYSVDAAWNHPSDKILGLTFFA